MSTGRAIGSAALAVALRARVGSDRVAAAPSSPTPGPHARVVPLPANWDGTSSARHGGRAPVSSRCAEEQARTVRMPNASCMVGEDRCCGIVRPSGPEPRLGPRDPLFNRAHRSERRRRPAPRAAGFRPTTTVGTVLLGSGRSRLLRGRDSRSSRRWSARPRPVLQTPSPASCLRTSATRTLAAGVAVARIGCGSPDVDRERATAVSLMPTVTASAALKPLRHAILGQIDPRELSSPSRPSGLKSVISPAHSRTLEGSRPCLRRTRLSVASSTPPLASYLDSRAYCAGFVVAFGTGLSRQTTCCFGPRPPLVPPLLVVPLVPPLEPTPLPKRRRQSLSDSQPM